MLVTSQGFLILLQGFEHLASFSGATCHDAESLGPIWRASTYIDGGKK